MRAKRTDANHREIAAALRLMGWKVIDLSAVGKGCPDLLAQRRGIVRLIECKTAKGTLTPQQVARQSEGWPVQIVRSLDDCANLE